MYKNSDHKNLFIVDHPLVQDKLTRLRDKRTDKRIFKEDLHDIAMLIGYEVTKHLKLKEIDIETPVTKTRGNIVANAPVIVPILRAALGMTSGLEALMPEAVFGHIGVYRDEKTKRPVEYLLKLPDMTDKQVILVDPMVATGHSAVYSMELLEKSGVKPENVRFMGLLAAPEGISVFEGAYPQVPLYFASLDEKLNEKSYIVPGLGDAGDRLFGTL